MIKVAVLRGGPSAEHEVSMLSGEHALQTLPRDKYKGLDVVITREGAWRLEERLLRPEDLSRRADVALNMLHGSFGEDGGVQKILTHHGISFTGSLALPSALGMDKVLSRRAFEQAGLLLPRAVVVQEDDDPEEAARLIFHTLPPDWVVKPARGGSSLGVKIVRAFHHLASAIRETLGLDRRVLVEERITGREMTVGVVENFRGEQFYAPPAVEIKPHHEICPAIIDPGLRAALAEAARAAHRAIGARHYSRSDFVIDRHGRVYVLEINTLPGMTRASLLPRALEAVGVSSGDFFDHLLSLALR